MEQHYAHYFAAPSGKWLIISRSPGLRLTDQIDKINVSGKREARRIAIARNAVCWNF